MTRIRGVPPAARSRAFGLLWGAESVSLLGTQVTLIAVPLIAVQVLNASGFVMGLLTAAGWLPVVLLGLPAGVFVDRGDRVRIMVAANLVRLLLISTVPLAYLMGGLSIGLLLAVALAAGVFAVFFDIAYQTHVPRTVSEATLPAANSRLELSRSLAQLCGPALGGVLVTALSAPNALIVDAATFLAGALLLAPLLSRRPARTSSGYPPALASIREGIAYIRGNRLIITVIAAASSSNLFTSGLVALQVLLAVKVLGMTPTVLGVMLAAEGLAALAGAALTPRLTRRAGESVVVLGSLCLMAAGAGQLFLASLTGAGTPLFLTGQLCLGLSGPMINILLVTIRQRLTPPELLGRVNATARVAIMTSLPIGSVLFGAVTSLAGLTTALLVIAMGLVVIAALSARPLGRTLRVHSEGFPE